MICAFCTTHLDTRDEAIEAGWWPSFFAGEEEFEGPVCPICSARFLERTPEGEIALKAGALIPPLAIPLRHRTND